MASQGRKTRITCAYCGEAAWRGVGHVNRSRKQGLSLYCDRKCAGLARRVNRSTAEKREIKRLYDKARRTALGDSMRAEKRAYYEANKERVLRQMREARKTPEYKARMRAYLKDYWKRPGLKAEKRDYDRKFRAQKKFGEYWEAHYLCMLINDEVLKRTTKYEIRLQNGTLNKAMNRGRNAEAKRSYT